MTERNRCRTLCTSSGCKSGVDLGSRRRLGCGGGSACHRGLQGLRWTSVRRPVVVKGLATSSRRGAPPLDTGSPTVAAPYPHPASPLAARARIRARRHATPVVKASDLHAEGRSRRRVTGSRPVPVAAVDDPVVGPIAHLRPRAATRRTGRARKQRGRDPAHSQTRGRVVRR